MEQKYHDGEMFKMAVAVSKKPNDILISEMKRFGRISKATFYRLYAKPVFTDDEKAAASKALGRSISEIFDNRNLEAYLQTITRSHDIKVDDLQDEINRKNIPPTAKESDRKNVDAYTDKNQGDKINSTLNSPLTKTKTETETDMENFMKDTINWQRGIIDQLLRKVPDIQEREKPANNDWRDERPGGLGAVGS